MKRFNMLKYILKFRFLIILVTLGGYILTCVYVRNAQEYTAQIVIGYTGTMAQEGMLPDGSPITADGIYSATVIADVKNELGLSGDIDSLRSHFIVAAVMSDDEIKIKNALLSDGKEYDKACTVYTVSFKTDAAHGRKFAFDVLNSAIDNYCLYYSRKYIDTAVIPNNAENISIDKYDYINCVEMLESSVSEAEYYLTVKSEHYPDFRSYETGYTYEDIKNRYEYIKNNIIPEYYAIVLGNSLTKNKDELITYYKNRLARDEIEISNLEEHILMQKALIESFTEKVTENGSITSETVIGDVDDRHTQVDPTATYDKLIADNVRLRSEKSAVEADRDNCEMILAVFDRQGVENSVDTKETDTFVKSMSGTIEEIKELYSILVLTSEEQNRHSAANSLKILSGVCVSESLNEKIYTLMGLMLSFVLGCAVAVTVGRCKEIFEDTFRKDEESEICCTEHENIK